jgi:polysaccharide transporter, PST family
MNNSAKKRLINNISYLSVLQIFNYGLPLLLIPYLINVLSADTYGIIILGQSLVLYFAIIVDYGFTLSATRDVAIHRDNKERLSEIYSSVMIIKLFLLVISLLLFVIIVSLFEKFNNYQEVYYISFIAVVGQTLFPHWYFQGREEMKHITIINVSSKIIFTLLTFIFVKYESDYLYVPLFYSLGFLFSGIWSQFIMVTKCNEKITLQSFAIIKKYFIDSTQFFWSRMSSSGYSNTNTFLIGILLPGQFVTYYYLADKIITVTLAIFNPIQQSIYPYLANKFSNKLFIYASAITFVAAVIITILISFLDGFISQILLGEIVESFINSLNLLVYLIPISIIYVMLGAPLLLAKGYIKEFNRSIIYGFIIHLILLLAVYLYSYKLNNNNDILEFFIYSLICSKFLVMLLRIYYVYKNKLHT